nr:MAG TPA: hypothetical protein [Caudoviricetes sp.]
MVKRMVSPPQTTYASCGCYTPSTTKQLIFIKNILYRNVNEFNLCESFHF